jgi:hypothetical protein
MKSLRSEGLLRLYVMYQCLCSDGLAVGLVQVLSMLNNKRKRGEISFCPGILSWVWLIFFPDLNNLPPMTYGRRPLIIDWLAG